jgi:hypothetical protein
MIRDGRRSYCMVSDSDVRSLRPERPRWSHRAIEFRKSHRDSAGFRRIDVRSRLRVRMRIGRVARLAPAKNSSNTVDRVGLDAIVSPSLVSEAAEILPARFERCETIELVV